jgi:transposase
MDSVGFSDLSESIRSHGRDFSEVMVAMESTGCYHLNLYTFLISQGIKTVVINPLIIANFAKLFLRKTKTDKRDALTIAQFLLIHKDAISQIALSQDVQDLRDLARERESLTVLIASLKNDIKRILQIKQVYLRRRMEGLSFKEAILATAHKLIWVIFAMLSNRTYFCA